MASINLGTFSDGWSGVSYTCYLVYDTPTRSGDNITVTNIKVQIVSQSGQGTEGRIAASLSINGSSKVNNATVAASYTYPTNVTTTILSTTTFGNLPTSFSYSVSVSDTGYGTTWNSTYSKTFSGSITCPARTYTVSYNANGGSGAPSSQSKTYNVTLTLSTTIPTYSGYTFKGWATSNTGVVTYQPGGSYTGNAAITLYAIWEQEYVPPEPRVIGFRGIWITVTSKLANVLKNIVIKMVKVENKLNNFTSISLFDSLLNSKMTTLQNKCAVDYIVEEGTYGSYGKWRKWNSGIAEYWTWGSFSNGGASTYGPYFYYTGAHGISFPSGLFSQGPVISINLIRNGGLIWPSIRTSNKTGLEFYIAEAANEGSATVYHTVKAIGRWK